MTLLKQTESKKKRYIEQTVYIFIKMLVAYVGNNGTDYLFYMHPIVARLERISRLSMEYK